MTDQEATSLCQQAACPDHRREKQVPETYTEEEQQAYDMGVRMAKAMAAGSFDGNSDVEERRRVLEMLRDGDPQAFDYLPRYPNLSGEFADDPTPRRLFEEIMGRTPNTPVMNEGYYGLRTDADRCNMLADAWEAGVADTFEPACEAELIKFTS